MNDIDDDIYDDDYYYWQNLQARLRQDAARWDLSIAVDVEEIDT